ncbi:MAG: hypothetical protein IPN86_07165 [Saprospiraceae bacterium]|nr:hypothetical protein [Saprospiraceae bacterium]
MKIIDLTKTSKLKLRNEVERICGGQSIEDQWISGPGRGLGGFAFKDNLLADDQNKNLFNCNLAFYKNGLGIYFRNGFSNYLVLIHEDEISSIELEKNSDIIKPYKYSLYSLLIKIGINPSKAAEYLMPKEIVKENIAYCIIRLPETHFDLELLSISIDKLKNRLSKTKFVHLLKLNLLPPRIFEF